MVSSETNVNSENLLSGQERRFSSPGADASSIFMWTQGTFRRHGVKSQNRLRVFREPLENVVVRAQDPDRPASLGRAPPERLRGFVRQQPQGVAIHHRGDEAKAGEFTRWGIWVGGVWSEEAEGTNGIGTCIAQAGAAAEMRRMNSRGRHA